MEQEIVKAIGLGRPEIVPEPESKPEPQLKVTIHDFGRLLSENEPPPLKR